MTNFFARFLAGNATDELTGLHLSFHPLLHPAMAAILLLGVAIGLYSYYWPTLHALDRRKQIFLFCLRTVILFLILTLLFDPCLVGHVMKPNEQSILLLFDDSESMTVQDVAGTPRSQQLIKAYTEPVINFEEQLQKKFTLQRFRFGETVEAIHSINHVSFSQKKSKILDSLPAVLREAGNDNVAGIILFSDGNEQPSVPLSSIQKIKDLQVPVYTIGIGSESLWKDIRVENVAVTRMNYDKSPVSVTVNLHADQLSGETATGTILLGHKTIQSKSFDITQDSQSNQLRFEFIPDREGWLDYTAVVSLGTQSPYSQIIEAASNEQTIDRVSHNNTHHFLVNNNRHEYRILYFSGSPNWEHKFIRSALKDDEEIKTDSLILISKAEKKFVYRGQRTTMTNPLFEGFEDNQEKYGRYDEPIFLRLGLQENELVDGYPEKAEELFPYHLVIWGDIDMNVLQSSHLETTRAFVEKRGGAFLLLSDPPTLANKDFINSPIAQMLPVILLPNAAKNEGYVPDFFSLRTTHDGEVSGVFTLEKDPDANRERWQTMPPLFGVTSLSLLRAAATTLAHPDHSLKEIQTAPLYLYHRYGKGRTALLSTPETWQWKMQQPEDDLSHERIWRQLVRQLVHDVPTPIQLLSIPETNLIHEPMNIDILVRDALFDEQEGSHLTVSIHTPSERTLPLRIEESIHQKGVYQGNYSPDETGLHRIHIAAKNQENKEIGVHEQAFLVKADQAEFQDAKYQPAFLQEIARTTGGQFFPIAQLADVASQIPWQPDKELETVRIHLWHNPFFLTLLLILLSVECYTRRKQGQP
jgi:hypothetical protein